MAINATNNGTARELTPAGNHVARCYQMIEIGTVVESFKGQSKTQRKVRIGWELPMEMRDFGGVDKPLVISKEYTLSMNEKSNLRKDLKSWRGKDFTEDEAKSFDITRLLGVACMLNIIHVQSEDGSRTYAQISGITPLPKGFTCPPQFNPTTELSYDHWDQDLYNALPDFIKDKMKASIEFASVNNPNATYIDNHVPEPIGSDDLPF
jgi:hypothetical protein